ncbi:MAG: glycosyltransferase [Ruminococcaceae bacterium]|nr:glycosyltransferase [Oscillospiraceae bacterium]
MQVIRFLIKAIRLISGFVSKIYKVRTFYVITGFFLTRKFAPAKKNHKYAILIAARNEEEVIGNLVDSIRRQDYPSELIDIFVVADNCDDGTAEVARALGAICYERNDKEHRTKGFALQYLVECIRRDYGIDSYEGYMIFDADNLLQKDFVTKMNDAFDAGEKIVASYRNTKNFDDNWISASYGLHWLRTIRKEHRARSLYHLATRIQGTGFLFAAELIRNGWNYTSLTEDRAFCADAVANGYKISYQNDAVFYDEQPVDMKIAMRQRIRWAKGHLQAFVETGPKLFKHIIVTGGAANREKTDAPRFLRFLRNIRLRFMSLDMLTVVYPRSVVTLFRRLLVFALQAVLIFCAADYAVSGPSLLGFSVLELLGMHAAGRAAQAFLFLTVAFFLTTIFSYLGSIVLAIYIFIIERKRIMPIKWYKKIWFCITFPIFDLIGKLSLVIALFTKVEWKPIPHHAAVNISEIEKNIQK